MNALFKLAKSVGWAALWALTILVPIATAPALAATPKPVASFTASTTSGPAPLAVTFTDTSTGTITSWAWSFGDSTYSSDPSPSKTYSKAGRYTVKLTVKNSGGSSSASKSITVAQPATAPVANFSASPVSGTAPLATTFTNTSTGSITDYAWDFGDGATLSTQTLTNPGHSYANAGVYTVKLTVTGSGGANTKTQNSYITVTQPATAPVANFSASPVSGTAPLATTFTNTSTGSITSYTWDFGDGATLSTETLTNPGHSYANAGVYTVKLTVTGSGGANTKTQSSYVTVTSPSSCRGVWICPDEMTGLPTSGAAWDAVYSQATTAVGTPNLANQDDMADMRVLARALVFARNGNETMRNEAIQGILAAIGTETNGTVDTALAVARNLLPYVVAADLVGLPPDAESRFTTWLNGIVNFPLLPSGSTLRSVHEKRPNNWGTHAGASRLAVALYLGNRQEVDQVAKVFKGWVGDGAATYAGFSYGALDWQADPNNPVGINPPGAMRDGHSIDGVLPDDQRRCCTGFVWPAPQENYVYEGLQGALAQAVMLHRAGFDVWNWQTQALRRAFDWLHTQDNFPAIGDDSWEPHLINYYYGTTFPAPVPSRPGKNIGYTDWTHGPGTKAK